MITAFAMTNSLRKISASAVEISPNELRALVPNHIGRANHHHTPAPSAACEHNSPSNALNASRAPGTSSQPSGREHRWATSKEGRSHLNCMVLLRSVSARALFMEGVTRSAYKMALPASCLVALPIVCRRAVSERRNPSASASRIHTRETSGRLRPWHQRTEACRGYIC